MRPPLSTQGWRLSSTFLALCFWQKNAEQQLWEPCSATWTVLMACVEHCLSPIYALIWWLCKEWYPLSSHQCSLVVKPCPAHGKRGVLVIIFPCSGLTDSFLSCRRGWELGNRTDCSGDSAVSSMDHKASKSKEIQALLFLFVVFRSSFYV